MAKVKWFRCSMKSYVCLNLHESLANIYNNTNIVIIIRYFSLMNICLLYLWPPIIIILL